MTNNTSNTGYAVLTTSRTAECDKGVNVNIGFEKMNLNLQGTVLKLSKTHKDFSLYFKM